MITVKEIQELRARAAERCDIVLLLICNEALGTEDTEGRAEARRACEHILIEASFANDPN